jgi:A/G-specific adenine glycosylase
MEKKFTAILMKWHRGANNRQMPWKGEKDPYKIWLSEIILQQTRVEQGWAYYTRFIKKYPTIKHLARAPDQEVYKLWEGLGYYTRCKNLLFTAREIVKEYKGIFPNQYEAILALKGVGPYTAAAIASFAYNQPYAVVDGNVFRVLARFFGIATPIDSTEGKNLFTALAGRVLSQKEPGLFNQAIMDFGATVCKPFSPACSHCPMQNNCNAFSEGTVNQLPVKEKTLQRKHRWLYYFLFEYNGKLLVQQRGAKDIWENLFEFYLVETAAQVKWDKSVVQSWLKDQIGASKAVVKTISKPAQQQLTHQQIKGQFIRVELSTMPSFLKKYHWQPIENIRELPFPKFITQYLSPSPSFVS